MDLLNEFELGRKYGKTFTFEDVKYDLDEFKQMIVDNEEFYNKIKQTIVDKINNVELKVEEHVED